MGSGLFNSATAAAASWSSPGFLTETARDLWRHPGRDAELAGEAATAASPEGAVPEAVKTAADAGGIALHGPEVLVDTWRLIESYWESR